jgi:hypothetical protein
MATTTNFGWTTPNDTDLVKDGALAIRTLGTAIDTTTKNLNPSTTLGDIEYRSSSANTNTRLGIGTTGQVLTVSGGVPAWTTPSTGSGFVGCMVYRNSAQTLSNNTQTTINWNAEQYDTNGFHDNSTNNNRLTIPSGKGGYYLVNLFVAFEAASSGTRSTQIYTDTGDLYCNSSVITAGTPYGSSCATSAVIYMNAGQYFEAKATQRSGGNLDLSTGIYAVNFSCAYLGA